MRPHTFCDDVCEVGRQYSENGRTSRGPGPTAIPVPAPPLLSDDLLEMVRRRIIVISLLARLPLLALSALEGQALSGRAAVLSCWTWKCMIRAPVAFFNIRVCIGDVGEN
ncbi:MAG TPA: hypothetical protein VIH18_25870 [Candidatus Binatia bacterium]|jgi:hypothetical protein